MNENNIFEAVCLLSTYVFVKENYQGSILPIEQDPKHIQALANMLAELDSYITFPDKSQAVKQSFNKLVDISMEGNVSETKLFEYIHSLLDNVSEDDKKNILNSVIYVSRSDRKVSSKEKELIQQVAHYLGLNSDYKIISTEYSKSGIKRSIETWKIFSLGASATVIIALITYFLVQSSIQKVNIFDEQSVAFSEVSFNRFIVYKNKYNSDNAYFKKQAVFYLNGTGEISFDPANLKYDHVTQSITYQYSQSLFQTTTNFQQSLLVDKIDPKPITEDDANAIGAVVGIASAIGGAKAGSAVSAILPANFRPFVAPLAGVATGLAGFWITSNALEGISISESITKEEEELVINTSKELIRFLLTSDPQLNFIYKNDFEKYITSRYQGFGLPVKSFQYSEVK